LNSIDGEARAAEGGDGGGGTGVGGEAAFTASKPTSASEPATSKPCTASEPTTAAPPVSPAVAVDASPVSPPAVPGESTRGDIRGGGTGVGGERKPPVPHAVAVDASPASPAVPSVKRGAVVHLAALLAAPGVGGGALHRLQRRSMPIDAEGGAAGGGDAGGSGGGGTGVGGEAAPPVERCRLTPC